MFLCPIPLNLAAKFQSQLKAVAVAGSSRPSRSSGGSGCSPPSLAATIVLFDYVGQFLPLRVSNSAASITSRQRLLILARFTRLIKSRQGYVLAAFSTEFSPVFLVQILKSFRDRQLALAFFKSVFRREDDDSATITLVSCCVAAHLLAAENLRFLAQDMLSWMVSKMGFPMNDQILELMWRGHQRYESAFSVLDSVLRAFLSAGMASQALRVLNKMREVGARPSLSALTLLFNLLLMSADYGSFWKVSKDMLRRCPPPSTLTLNALIVRFCRKGWISVAQSLSYLMHKFCCLPNAEGNLTEARKLFDGIQEMGMSPETTMCKTLINGYVKAREITQVDLLYAEMIKKGIPPDGITFNVLVAEHYKYKWEDISVTSLCWAGCLDDAMGTLEDMLEKGIPVSVVAFNFIIAAFSQEGLEDEAFSAYQTMVKFGLLPSSSTCSSLLMCLSYKGRLEEAAELIYKMMENGLPIHKVAFTVLFDGRCKEEELSPDAVAFSAFINGFSEASLMEEAYNVFEEMFVKGLVPNNFVYNSLIGGFCILQPREVE
ncbi:Pentatricopeptide repeat [Dillenia turbinata]|uniref:Pentatricopeptide repeat n=1 Tax=Dillenia turbinata TaxID=194707 RepID=A0AAN8V0B5_9MAGN